MKLYRDGLSSQILTEVKKSLFRIAAVTVASFTFFAGMTVYRDGKTIENYRQMCQDQYQAIVYDAYQEMVSETAMTLYQWGIKDPTQIFAVVSQLIEAGVFSEVSFNPEEESYLDVVGYLGLDIVEGRGVCRHTSAFLHDVYREMGYDSHLVAGHLGEVEAGQTVQSNHLLVLINDQNRIYLFDPTNFTFYEPENQVWRDVLHDEAFQVMAYRSYSAGYQELKEIIHLQRDLFWQNKNRDPKTGLEDVITGLNWFAENEEEVKQLHLRLKPQISLICEELE